MFKLFWIMLSLGAPEIKQLMNIHQLQRTAKEYAAERRIYRRRDQYTKPTQTSF